MPSRKNSGLADRVVRKRLSDGSVKEYRYPRHGQGSQQQERGSLGALVTAYKGSQEWLRKAPVTRETQEIYLRHLEALSQIQAAAIKRRMLLTLRDAIAAGRGPGAATMFVRCCSVLFAWAVEREYLEYSPAIGIKVLPGGHWKAWTQPEIDAALKVLPEALRRALLLALYTGQRRGDLVRMLWEQYDGRVIRLTQQKTQHPLVIPVHATLKAELDAWRAEKKSAFMLHTRYRTQWNPGSLTNRIAYVLREKGLPQIGIHGLRKLAASNLADAGCTMHEIAAITGHRSLSMVQLYTAGADQERLANAAIVRLTAGSDKQKKAR